MNRIEELIQKLCPDGVKCDKIKNVFLRLKGTPITASKMKEIACPDGEIRIFAGGKTIIDAHEKDIPKANITRVPAVLVQSRGIIDVIYYDKPFTFKNEMWAYSSSNPVTTKFLYYVLKSNIEKFREAASGMGSLPQISLSVTDDFRVPVPPLEIQQEIVRILDQFTQLTTQLTTELTEREKQYQYYRCQLLTFNSSVPSKTLSEVCNILSGGDAPRNAISKEKTEQYKIPIISNGIKGNDIYGYTNIKKIDSPAVTIAARGTIGYAAYRDYPYFPIIRLLSAIPKDSSLLDTKFLYYCLRDKQYNIPQSGIPQLTTPQLKKVEIPLPPLPEQRRIVSILDRFDALCNNLTSGLPAEIAARQKQYEYYRDKLLTFPERKEADA